MSLTGNFERKRLDVEMSGWNLRGSERIREEGRKMSKIENESVGGALFIGRPYTPAVTSADVCMTVHCRAYQR